MAVGASDMKISKIKIVSYLYRNRKNFPPAAGHPMSTILHHGGWKSFSNYHLSLRPMGVFYFETKWNSYNIKVENTLCALKDTSVTSFAAKRRVFVVEILKITLKPTSIYNV